MRRPWKILGMMMAACVVMACSGKTVAPIAPASGGAPSAPLPKSADGKSGITVYIAKKIITMNPAQPEATAVAVKDGKIFAVASLNDMKGWWGDAAFTLDQTFADKVIIPGLIEAHSHLGMMGAFWQLPYVGFYDIPGPRGMVKGVRAREDMLARLKEEDKRLTDPQTLLMAWGFDPIFTPGILLNAKDLDQVSTTRPIFVMQSSGHVATANSALLTAAGIGSDTTLVGVVKDSAGKPTGTLREAEVLRKVLPLIASRMFDPKAVVAGIQDAARLVHGAGATMAADWVFGFGDPAAEALMHQEYLKATTDANYPIRIVLGLDGSGAIERSASPEAALGYFQEMARKNTDKLILNTVKFIADGSPQGFTARYEWPLYYNGSPNGIVNTTEDQLFTQALPFWKAGIQVRVHVNGDESTNSALNALDRLLRASPWWDHRFVLEHDPRATQAQLFRASRLGACINFFMNHVYYYGDAHAEQIDGPDLAQRMFAVASVQRMKIPFSMHSDAPVTPIQPLLYVWEAVNRQTASGRKLDKFETISAHDALEAVTLGSARVLKLDDKIGSIETGKWADFTILNGDPLTVPREKIRDITIWGTVLSGKLFPL